MRKGAVAIIAVILLAGLAGCGRGQPTTTPIQYATASVKPDLSGIPLAAAEPDPDGATLVNVSMGAGGELISVNFKAPKSLTNGWWQGSIYVIDEATSKLYDQIPYMPIVGPLLGKPSQDDQVGYCMLNNTDMGVKAGSLLTVVLGKYKRVHIRVQ